MWPPCFLYAVAKQVMAGLNEAGQDWIANSEVFTTRLMLVAFSERSTKTTFSASSPSMCITDRQYWLFQRTSVCGSFGLAKVLLHAMVKTIESRQVNFFISIQ